MARKPKRPGKAVKALQEEIGAVCGALTKTGDPCMNPQGKGTDHLGSGCCHIHDNYLQVTRRKPGGRYSEGLADSALEFYLDLVQDPEVKKIDDEIAMLRTALNDTNLMMKDIRDRAAETTDNPLNPLNASRPGKYLPASGGPKVDPFGAEDRKALLQLNRDRTRIAESVAKLVSQKHRIEEGKIVTYRQVQEVLAQVVYVVTKHVHDDDVRNAIAEDFSRIDVSKFDIA